MSTTTRSTKHYQAFDRASTEYDKYVGCAAGIMRYYEVELPKEIPHEAIFQEDYSFAWIEMIETTILNPTQRSSVCIHHRLELLESTDWQLESGTLPVMCVVCGYRSTISFWGHSGHIPGTRELCYICQRKGEWKRPV